MDRISQKDGSRVQVVLRCTDKGATKPSFEKLCGNLSFLLFTKGTTFAHYDRVVTGQNRALYNK